MYHSPHDTTFTCHKRIMHNTTDDTIITCHKGIMHNATHDTTLHVPHHDGERKSIISTAPKGCVSQTLYV